MVRDFCGHGLGRVFHDRPNILHYGEPGEGLQLKPGMLFTIEPMINLGKPHVKILSDGWTAVTRDRSLSAQFEHTVGVTETGCEVFTALAARVATGRLTVANRAKAEWVSRMRASHIISAIARGCRRRFREAGARRPARLRAARADPVSRRAAPRHQTSGQGPDRPLRHLRRGGERARGAVARGTRHRRGGDHRAQAGARRGAQTDARRGAGAAGAVVLGPGARLLPRLDGVRQARSSFASCSSTSATRSSPTRCSRRAPSTIPRSMCARWSSGRSSCRRRRSCWCTITPRATPRRRAPISR